MQNVTVRRAEEKDFRRIAGIDRESASEIRYHADVIPETVLLYEEGNRAYGVGYVLKGPGRFLHLVVRIRPGSEKGVRAAEALFGALRDRFYALPSAAQKRNAPVLRAFARSEETAYRAFLRSFGFRKEDRMYVMERFLADVEPGKDGKAGETSAVRLADLRSSEAMRKYLELTNEAYGIPDREGEMRYRLTVGKGRVFAYYKDGTPVSFVTVWPKEAGVSATENVFTVAKERRKGYAETLLNEVAFRLKTEGVSAVRLSVYVSDEAAVALYLKLGYRVVYELSEYRLRQRLAAGDKQ